MKFPPARRSRAPFYRSAGHRRFSLHKTVSRERDWSSGFEWDCSRARCLVLLPWMTSWIAGIPRSVWSVALVTYRGGVNNRSQYFWLASLYDSYVRLGSTAPQFEAIGPYGSDYGFGTVCYVSSLLRVSVTVTIIRQTFHYTDMTCSVLTVWDPILFTFAVYKFRYLDNK
jgi:hypothetical protein